MLAVHQSASPGCPQSTWCDSLCVMGASAVPMQIQVLCRRDGMPEPWMHRERGCGSRRPRLTFACRDVSVETRVRVRVQAPKSMREPFILTTRPLGELVAEHQMWARVARTCAIGCSVVGAALVVGQVVAGVHAVLRRRALR